MPDVHDAVLIGAGPAAVATLAALPLGVNTAVTTGASAAFIARSAKVHPKIRAVSHIRKEPPGITRLLPFDAPEAGQLFDTAAVGGLANYWGQQFVRYEENDPWPRSIFTSHNDYISACARIEAMFSCSPGDEEQAARLLNEGFVRRTPNLLTGTKQSPHRDLLAMRQAFQELATTRGVQLTDAPAMRWEMTGDKIRVYLADGNSLYGRRLILAAGAVGSLRLAMASYPEITAISLRDHAPYMIHTAGTVRKHDLARTDGLAHFNSLTVERIEQGRVHIFASFYRMSQAPIGLTLAALGLPPFFSRMKPPGFVDLMTPVQVWTASSRMRYRLNRGEGRARLVERPDPDSDDDLRLFRHWLPDKGFVLRMSVTRPGEGFHYHAGEVSLDGHSFMPLTTFLRERSEDRIVNLDATMLDEIGCRPHTLTAMAAAWKLADSYWR